MHSKTANLHSKTLSQRKRARESARERQTETDRVKQRQTEKRDYEELKIDWHI